MKIHTLPVMSDVLPNSTHIYAGRGYDIYRCPAIGEYVVKHPPRRRSSFED